MQICACTKAIEVHYRELKPVQNEQDIPTCVYRAAWQHPLPASHYHPL